MYLETDRQTYLHNNTYGIAFLTNGMTKGSLKPRLLAIVSTGLRHENMAAKRMIFPMRGLTGRFARW